MAKIVYLFPDTNVFVQCRPLEQLDWSAWCTFDEVHLIVSRPIQSEIDEGKNKGGERVARRARKASSLLRDIIIGGLDHLPVRPANPVVKLIMRTALRPSSDLATSLDYSRPDDQLVGTVYSFVQQNSTVDARLLTHDTGPMASAQMVGIAIAPVPDDWLLPPEPSGADRRIRALEEEVARLRATEPQFSIACIGMDGNELDRLEFEVSHYEPLSPGELAALIKRLRELFPLGTDFGPRERAERAARGVTGFMGWKEVFTPATEKEIEEYREKHAQWLEQCEDRLRNLHQALQAGELPPAFVFVACNNGTRPANGALVTFRAKGRFGIMPPRSHSREDDDEEADEPSDNAAALPSPPAVPRGKWTSVLASQLGAFDALRGFVPGSEFASVRPVMPEFPKGYMSPLKRRDPNAFYYKPERPSVPGEEFSLECEQWRHGIEPEQFSGQIHFDQDEEDISGAIECRIHAGNLSQSAAKLVPVHISVRRVKALDIAEDMAEAIR